MNSSDTIAAISSAIGPAARMIVRMSGERATEIARHVCADLSLARTFARIALGFADMTVPAFVCISASPHSYTGEDLVEFHIPGSPLLARMLLDQLVKNGARRAEAGEFTARAYFTGRLDLAAAEGVAAVVSAQNEHELRAARQLMAGELAIRLRPLMDSLTQTLALLEAGIDFSEEDISFISRDELYSQIEQLDQQLGHLMESSSRFERLTHEPTFVLVGRPNAGKSTLLNALAGHDRAVVSPVAGTTRDVLSAHVMLRRGIVRILDVAGLDESPTPHEPIAHQMTDHALRAIESADFVILVKDVTDEAPPLAPSRTPELTVITKSDLCPSTPSPNLNVSALTGANIDRLRDSLDQIAFGPHSAGSFALNARHMESIENARAALSRAREIISSAGHELIALELREALDSLGQILGQIAPDDVLGRIFSSFCIGK